MDNLAFYRLENQSRIRKIVNGICTFFKRLQKLDPLLSPFISADELLEIILGTPFTSEDSKYRDAFRFHLITLVEQQLLGMLFDDAILVINDTEVKDPPYVPIDYSVQHAGGGPMTRTKLSKLVRLEDEQKMLARRNKIEKYTTQKIKALGVCKEAELRVSQMSQSLTKLHRKIAAARAAKWEAEQNIKEAQDMMIVANEKRNDLDSQIGKLVEEMHARQQKIDTQTKCDILPSS